MHRPCLSIQEYLTMCASTHILTIMRIPTEPRAIQLAVERLREILNPAYGPDGPGCARYEVGVTVDDRLRVLDAIYTVGPHSFALEWRRTGTLMHVTNAVLYLKHTVCGPLRSEIPLVAVPYMGESGRAYCEQNGVAWLDLSGNTSISATGLYIQVIGRPNQFRRPGRPESAFGPKGSRIARWLLMNPSATIRQRALASATGLDEGYVSRVVRKLIDGRLAIRDDRGIEICDADLLLDTWNEEYRFDRHTLIAGHIAAATGENLTRQVAHTLAERQVPYAATGLAAAWMWTKYAGFRLSTVYLKDAPSTELTTTLGFRDEPRGANIWLVVPNDEGVFYGATDVEGVRCVHPIQTILDLKAHPERSREAIDVLRRHLAWNGDAA